MPRQRWNMLWRLPSGEVKTTGPHLTVSKSVVAAGQCLKDNTGCGNAEARDLCQRIVAVRGAEWVEHTSGYAFRVEAASE